MSGNFGIVFNSGNTIRNGEEKTPLQRYKEFKYKPFYKNFTIRLVNNFGQPLTGFDLLRGNGSFGLTPINLTKNNMVDLREYQRDIPKYFSSLNSTSCPIDNIYVSPVSMGVINDFTPSTIPTIDLTEIKTDNKKRHNKQSLKVHEVKNNNKIQSSKLNKSVANQSVSGLGPEFLTRVKEIAININCDYRDLLAVINAESGFQAGIQNKKGNNHWGLIQFGKDAAKDIGTTINALKQMSALEQLDYVEKYYLLVKNRRNWGDKPMSAGDLYAATFLPSRANREVLCEAGEINPKTGKLRRWYEANAKTDLDRNGKIEKWELEQRIKNFRVDENMFLA